MPNPHDFHTPQPSYTRDELLRSSEGGYFGPGNAQLPSPPMLMMDRITEISLDGGEEFVVVLPNTALRQALTVADHIRRAVMAKELKKKSTGEILGRVTISVGVSMLKQGDDTDALIERADACLYAAKRNGRNRVICEADPEFAVETHNRVA